MLQAQSVLRLLWLLKLYKLWVRPWSIPTAWHIRWKPIGEMDLCRTTEAISIPIYAWIAIDNFFESVSSDDLERFVRGMNAQKNSDEFGRTGSISLSLVPRKHVVPGQPKWKERSLSLECSVNPIESGQDGTNAMKTRKLPAKCQVAATKSRFGTHLFQRTCIVKRPNFSRLCVVQPFVRFISLSMAAVCCLGGSYWPRKRAEQGAFVRDTNRHFRPQIKSTVKGANATKGRLHCRMRQSNKDSGMVIGWSEKGETEQ